MDTKTTDTVLSKDIEKVVTMKNESDKLEENIQKNYSKNNKFIFGNKAYSCNKFKISYNFIKFFIIFTFVIFSLLSLWYVTQWKKDTLKNLGVNFSKFLGENETLENLFEKDKIDLLNSISTLTLTQWKSTNITEMLLDVLLSFCFIGLIALIPSLVFKNGTLFSVISLSFVLISLIIVMSIFFVGIQEQQKVLSIYNSTKKPSRAKEILDKIAELVK